MIPRREFLKIGGLSLSLPVFVRGLFASSPGGGDDLGNLTAGVRPLDPEDYEERRERAVRGIFNLFLQWLHSAH